MKIVIGAFLAIITIQFMYIEKITQDIIYINKNLHSYKNKVIKERIKLKIKNAVYTEVCK